MAEVVRAAGLLIYRIRSNVNEYLMLQASYEPFHWTPPKGHVDADEDEWTAAIRETREETGIDAAKQLEIFKDFCHVMDYTANGKPKRVTYWLANLKSCSTLPNSDVKLSHEHQNLKWANAEEAIRIGKYAETEIMIRKAEEYLAKKK